MLVLLLANERYQIVECRLIAAFLAGAIGKVSAGIIVAIYLRRFAIYIFVTASVISFWAAWYNMWGHKIYIPKILVWFTW